MTTTTQVIEAYLAQCAKDRLLTVSIAVGEVRAGLPGCELTDDELAQLIALHAVAAGFTLISFDLTAHRHAIELPVISNIPGWPALGSPARLSAMDPVMPPSRLPPDASASN